MKVFLSHASADKPFVRMLASDLRANEIDVWLDEDILKPGDSVTDVIARGLEDADLVVLVVSRAFLASAWARVESNSALGASISANQGKVVPALLEDVWALVSPLLRDRLYVDFRDRQNIGAYQESLRRLVAKVHGETASAVLTTRRTVVMCSGGRDTQSDGRDFAIAFEVGRALGGAGVAMRTGIARGVDSMFAKGAADTLIASGKRVRDSLTCYYAGREYPRDHEHGRMIESRYSSRSQGVPELITDSDIAVLIGGQKNTMYLGVLMMLEGKPIIPVASSGGAAADLYNLVMSRFEKSFSVHVDREMFAELADVSLDPAEAASVCVHLITLLRGPAPAVA